MGMQFFMSDGLFPLFSVSSGASSRQNADSSEEFDSGLPWTSCTPEEPGQDDLQLSSAWC